jgi:hypothetical protein
MRYDGYTSSQRTDDILDKISRHGIKSISKLEKRFLDAHKHGKEELMHILLTKEESERFFLDDSGMFGFEFDSIEDFGDQIHYLGILICPDLVLESGKTISGRLSGQIVYYADVDMAIPDYGVEIDGKLLDVFDFCEGYEYELDNFIDYLVEELEQSGD